MRKDILIAVSCGLAALAFCDASSAPPAKSAEAAGDTASKVRQIVVQQLGIEPSRVTLGARFCRDLGADSLDVVELIMAFEEEFGVQITDDAVARMVTVGDALAWLDAGKGRPVSAAPGNVR